MIPIDRTDNAMTALMAASAGEAAWQLGGLAARHERLIRRLRKFSFPSVVQPLAGLLTKPENHTATGRFEALIHLAAMSCRGTLAPTVAQLREWMNKIILTDRTTDLEDPVEDVFVSNVATWFGNVRLFDGKWGDNDFYVQAALAGLGKLKDHPWAAEAQKHVITMLRLSEAIASRARVPRFTLTDSLPKRPVRITEDAVRGSRANVTFTGNDFFALGLPPGHLSKRRAEKRTRIPPLFVTLSADCA